MNEPSDVKQQFDSFFADRSATSKGRVFVLDLSPVKDVLGDRWEKLKQQVYLTTSDVVLHRIQPTDIHCRWDDERYLVAFGALDQARGRIKISLIAQEITQRLLGSTDQDKAIKISMATTDENGEFSWDKDAAPSKLAVEKTLPKAPIKNEQTKEKPDAVGRDGIDFVFRPLWFVKNKIISSYFCIPVRDKGDGHFLSGYDILNDPQDPHAITALDLLTMKRIHKEALALEDTKMPALLAVPIHFESIASGGRRSTLIDQCKKNLGPHRNKIVIELTNLPEGIPQSRLQDFIQILKPFSRSVMARFSSGHRDFAGFKHVGLHAVGIDLYGDRREESKIIQSLEGFVENASKLGLHTYAHGVRSISLTTAAICAGIDYVDGYAISDVHEGARDIKHYSIRMPYASKYSADEPSHE